MQPEKEEQYDVLFDFEKLDVYNKALEMVNTILELTEEFPKRYEYSLVSQLNRSSLSILLNISEGCNSFYKDEKKRYFRIARGSVFESVASLRISLRRGFISKKNFHDLYEECYDISKMVSGLITSVDKRKDGEWHKNCNKNEK
jgi:four helix bundle protein